MIIHVDMDAFYASVEQRDNPELAGKPVIVGGNAESRGVVAAASYEARKFGVRNAMPAATALRKCPNAIFVPARIDRYSETSREFNLILQRFSPLVEPLALDEAFLDIAGSEQLFGPPQAVGRQIKSAIKTELNLTASVGIASNKFLAKLCSDISKPDGLKILTPPVQNFLDPLPVTRLWGIGAKASKCLEQHGIRTIEQLRKSAKVDLEHCVGNAAERLIELASGIDHRTVAVASNPKSISKETTFASDISDQEHLRSILFDEVQEIAARVRLKGLRAKQISIKLRYANFRTITRSKSLAQSTDLTQDFWNIAADILQQTVKELGVQPVRLIGVRASNFCDQRSGQLDLFPSTIRIRQQKLDRMIDKINTRFGKGSLHRGGSAKH